jgi:hypothetical protein
MVRYHQKNGIKQHWNRTRQTIEKSWKSLRNGEIDETWQGYGQKSGLLRSITGNQPTTGDREI